jgi:carboxyl-terminal processing protease
LIRRRVLLGVLLAVLFALGWWAGRGRASGDLYANLDLFVEILHAVQTSYVDEVESGPLVEGGLHGMLRALDPWSEYLSAKEYTGLRGTLDGEFEGIGVYLDSHEGWPVVIAPVEGSPAWKAGLEAGDVIAKVDGATTWSLSPPELSAKLRGAAGTDVKLTVVRRNEQAERELSLTRARVEVPAVRDVSVMPGGVGYLRLATFNEHATADVRAALDTLRARGARSVVVDLRGNPGGLVDQAVGVAGAFLPSGSLVTFTEGRRAESTQKLLVAKDAKPVSWPMAVLVDGGSASASEILAGALQDLDRALVVGVNSYGKGTVQSVFPLRNRAGAIKLTTAYYHTPSGRSIHRKPPGTGEDAGDDEEDVAPADSASTTPADSAARPEFKTRAGRKVYGGGGISPDLEVKPDSLPAARSAAVTPEALAHDPVVQRAADVLRRAKAPADVFAASGPPPAAAKRPDVKAIPPHGARKTR